MTNAARKVCGACGGPLAPDEKRQHDDPTDCLIELRERIERLEQRAKPVAYRRPFILGPGR